MGSIRTKQEQFGKRKMMLKAKIFNLMFSNGFSRCVEALPDQPPLCARQRRFILQLVRHYTI
jgi:hypothetical protein